jgi:hypothetical protein
MSAMRHAEDEIEFGDDPSSFVFLHKPRLIPLKIDLQHQKNSHIMNE